MGKICDNNLFFFFTNSDYVDYVCFLAIFLCLILLILLQYKNLFKRKFSILKNVLFVLVPILFIVFFACTFYFMSNKDSYQGCMNSYSKIHTDSKIIISGDSRMEFIEDDKEIILPYNVSFVAKSGATIDWFVNNGVPEFRRILNNLDDDFSYYVVVNMGVNDIQENLNINDMADEYFKYYKDFANINKKVKFYILSVNPIVKSKLDKSQPFNIRTNKKIEQFNDRIIYDLKNKGTNNMYYCDSYHDLKFDTDDGLHYTRETNKKIIKYITDDCIKY